ncbi:xylan alpha-(1-_2)-glucuronosidase [Isoptericola halotolerans]|uniref:Alpha-glucuronidase n=1 Tax=Isoptericola halotolerans TaxID=300560 RepID=A0ABX1ZZW1_9MICO|nr:alpha-glucuronidase [Isoptericola halotolerans]NOV96006.1 alpha-glucuronidase [Isoptericola halotolerans]
MLDNDFHPAWLPDAALQTVGSRRLALRSPDDEAGVPVGSSSRDRQLEGPIATEHTDRSSSRRTDRAVLATLSAELDRATRAHGGAVVGHDDEPDLLLALDPADPAPAEPAEPAGYRLLRAAGRVTVTADHPTSLLHGWFHVVRLGAVAFDGPDTDEHHAPVSALRMLDHWDNVDVHPVMGQVERGYAGGSIFYDAGHVRADLSRVTTYARLLAAVGIDRVAINNVNVAAREARLLTDDLPEVARIAAALRPYGVRTHLSVSFASPVTLGGLPTSDPLDPAVRTWWRDAADVVWRAVPDFGGFVVKADSEGQPGPFAHGRDHADGANMLAEAVAPHGGLVHWRAFVYNHTQDWRDRTTDRARAAHDHFAPLDGRFAGNVVVQVKHGPVDFQVREPVSPVLAAMPRTRVALELQVTQEYTGQQRHAVYLGPAWSEILRWQPWGDAAGPDDAPDGGAPVTVADLASGRGPGGQGGGIAAVSNVGDDRFWTGHPLAQANLYAFGRLAWDPALDPPAVLDEWIDLTFPGAPAELRAAVHAILDESWHTYELYTAPLGIGFMVRPGHHYGPDVDGYEYTPWGTYHFADRDGIGVDRTRATGTGYTGQYPAPWREVYESLDSCPDELLLFFHHVPYTHVLHSGKTVVQHVYDTHFEGVERVERMVERWEDVAGLVPDDVARRVSDRLTEQRRSAVEWRDQVTTYFWRKSGIPDEQGRTIY